MVQQKDQTNCEISSINYQETLQCVAQQAYPPPELDYL